MKYVCKLYSLPVGSHVLADLWLQVYSVYLDDFGVSALISTVQTQHNLSPLTN